MAGTDMLRGLAWAVTVLNYKCGGVVSEVYCPKTVSGGVEPWC